MSNGGLKVGDVFVAVSASLGEFSKGMDRLLKDVEKAAGAIGKSMQEAADAVGGFSEKLLGFAAVAGAAVAGAAEHSEEGQKANDGLRHSILQLSRDVGTAFLPLVRELTQGIRTLTATWRGLSSNTRSFIVDAVRQAAIMGVVGLAMSRALIVGKSLADGVVLLTKATRAFGPALVDKLADITKGAGAALTKFNAFMRVPVGTHIQAMSNGLASLKGRIAQLPGMAESLTSSFKTMLRPLIGITVPVLVVAAAVGALVLLAGSLYDAWDNGATGLKASVEELGDYVVALARSVRDTLTGLFDAMRAFVIGAVVVFAEVFAEKVRFIASIAEKVAHYAGDAKMEAQFKNIQNLTATGIATFVERRINEGADAARKAMDAPIEAFRDARDAVTDGLDSSIRGVKKLVDKIDIPDIGKSLKELLDNFFGDPDKVEREHSFEKDADAAGGHDYDDFAQVRELGRKGRTVIQEGLNEHARVLREAAIEHARVVREAMRAAKDALQSQFLSATGEVGGVLNTFVTGITADGGLFGGFTAVLGQLLMKSEGFAALMGMVGNMFQQAADILGAVLTPLQGLIGAISMVLDGVLRPIAPLFGVIGAVLQPLVPALAILGEMLNAVAPALAALAQVVLAVLVPLQLLSGPIMTALFNVLKVVSIIIMAVVWAIGSAWNGIVSAVQWVFRSIGELEIGDWRPFEALSDWADSMESAKAPVDGLKDSMGELWDMTLDEARAKADATAQQLKNTQAVKEATEALTNVPPAWRFARNKYLSQDAQSGPSGAAPAPSPTNTAPSAPAASAPAQQAPSATPPVTVEQVYNLVMQGDLKTALEQAKRLQRDAAFRLGRALPGLFAGGV